MALQRALLPALEPLQKDNVVIAAIRATHSRRINPGGWLDALFLNTVKQTGFTDDVRADSFREDLVEDAGLAEKACQKASC